MSLRALLASVLLAACKHTDSTPVTRVVLPEIDAGQIAAVDSGQPEKHDAAPSVTMVAERVSVGGGRSFLWARTGTEPANAPLLMVLHGDGGDGQGMRNDVGAALEKLAFAQVQFVYPDGVGRTWDTNTVGSPADLAYLEAIRGSFTGARAPRAVYLFGYSRGGFMANLLACEHSDWVTAIASNAGGAPYATSIKGSDGVSRCPGQKPVASIALHGMQDTEVAFADAPWTGAYWANINGCDMNTMVATGESVCKAYASCPVATPSWFCAVPGVGHSVWSEAPRVAWGFFSSLPTK